jgi:hypothetical protein
MPESMIVTKWDVGFQRQVRHVDNCLGRYQSPERVPGPLKRLHFSTGNYHGPASGDNADSLADTAAASGDYRGSHVV